MNVAIWDMEWYYAQNKTNLINIDAMKISSYHKQIGDSVHLVATKFDVSRDWDLMYIIKEDWKTPAPPLSMILNNPKIKILGNGIKNKNKFKLNNIFAACRPDYLLYPNMTKYDSTAFEKSEYWRFLDNEGNLLPLIQDASRLENKNFVVVADKDLWAKDNQKIIIVLDKIKEMNKNVSFLEPIWIEKIISDKVIRDKFLELKFTHKNNISWTYLKYDSLQEFCKFYKKFKELHPLVVFNPIKVKCGENLNEHWTNKDVALQDFYHLLEIIKETYKVNLKIEIDYPAATSTPYFPIFQNLSEFSKETRGYCWLEFLSYKYHKQVRKNYESVYKLWISPERWNEEFRDLIRHTYEDREFCLLRKGRTSFKENKVPWDLWKSLFKYKI